MKKEAETQLQLEFRDIIKFDVQRTTFPENNEEHKQTLRSILNSIAHSKQNINYCQGMNYITSFLLQLLEYKEEATYHLMMALLDEMNYDQIYLPKLYKLKEAFFVLERLITLYLPKLNDLFQQLSINVNYFCPPWFLTLFTNSNTMIDLSEPPFTTLTIWTNFIISGWKALMISSLTLLKLHEPLILKLNSDEILLFIINKVSSSNMLDNDHKDQFFQILSQYNLSKNIISNIESEFNISQQTE